MISPTFPGPQACNYRRYGVKNPILHPICHSLPTLSHLRIQTALISTTFSISMTVWAEVIPDLVLAALYSYLLIRLATSSDIFFKTPFYTLFITTGSCFPTIYWMITFRSLQYHIRNFIHSHDPIPLHRALLDRLHLQDCLCSINN